MDAEVKAITFALLHPIVAATDAHIVVFTDSMAALSALQHHQSSTIPHTALLHELLITLEALKAHDPHRLIHMQWIPAHVRIPGNEQADTLAAQGAKLPPPYPTIPLEAIKQAQNTHLLHQWHALWAESLSPQWQLSIMHWALPLPSIHHPQWISSP